MNVQLLIVRMVQGVKLEAQWGPRGGFQGYFLGTQKVNGRTFSAAHSQGLITRSTPEPTFVAGYKFQAYKLTPEAAIEAERSLAYLPDREYADSRTEYHFKHLVPGVEIFYGYMFEDVHEDRGYWLAAREGRIVIAKASELEACIEAARIALRPQLPQTAAVLSQAEAERIREGSDNPAAIQERMDAVAATPKAWNCEVIADRSGNWTGNGCYFATKEEADAYGRDLMGRWMLVTQIRSVEIERAVNYKWVDGKLESVASAGGAQ